MTGERVAAFADVITAANDPQQFAKLTIQLLEEHGATSYAVIRSEVGDGGLKLTPQFQTVSWGSAFGDLSKQLEPTNLKALTRKTMHGRIGGPRLAHVLVATRDVRVFDALGLANALGIRRRNPPTGSVLAIPISKSPTEAMHVLAHFPHRKGLVEHGFAPLLRATVLHKTDHTTHPKGGGVGQQWLLLTTDSVVAASRELKRRKPDLALEPGTPIEQTFPAGAAELKHLESALLLEPKPEPVTLDLDATAKGKHGTYQVTLAFEVTPVRLDATRYAFFARPTSGEGESLIDLGNEAILHTTQHQIGLFLTLDRFGAIHYATESLTDNLGYETRTIKDLNIAALLDEESVAKFNALRQATLELVNEPGNNSRVPNPERVPVKLQARDGTPREFDLTLTLLRARVEGEAQVRGFVAVLAITSSQMLLQKELTERLRFVRHDRHSSANAIAALVDEIRKAPNLTRNDLDTRLTDIQDEARVWSEITDTHAQLLEAITTLNVPKTTPADQLLPLSEGILAEVPRYVRFYARHKLRRAERELVDVAVDERLQDVTAWARADGRLTSLYAMRNLVENAVKYTVPERDGRRVITATVRLDPEQPDHVCIELSNATQGITAEALDDVWGYRRRLDNAATMAMGTGIGLWSTKMLVERAGGHVGAYLHDGGRCISFYISFPLIAFANQHGRRTIVRTVQNGRLEHVHPEDVRTLVRFSTTPRGTRPRVLLVDSDIEDLNISASHFKHVNADVKTVEDASHATAMLTSGEYDLLLAEYDASQRDELEALFRMARRRGVTARVLTSTPSAIPTSTLQASSATTVIFKDALTPIIAANLAYGRRESHELTNS